MAGRRHEWRRGTHECVRHENQQAQLPPRERGSSMAETLAGRVVLVTGAAKRIGRSIALRLAAEGARVAIHYNGSEREARATAEECGGASIFKANLESVAEIRGLFDRVAGEFGRLHGLVNNAA